MIPKGPPIELPRSHPQIGGAITMGGGGGGGLLSS